MVEGSQQEEAREDKSPPRRLYRSDKQRILGGICGGLGEYFGTDPVWFRLGFVVLTVAGGSGILIYLVMWLIVPRAPADYNPPNTSSGSLPGSAVVGLILVVVGGIALLNAISPGLGRYFWPVLLLVAGLALLAGGLGRDRN